MSDSTQPVPKKRKSELLDFAAAITKTVEEFNGKTAGPPDPLATGWIPNSDGTAKNYSFSGCVVQSNRFGGIDLINIGDFVVLAYDEDTSSKFTTKEGLAQVVAVHLPPFTDLSGPTITYKWLWSSGDVKKDLPESVESPMRMGEWALGADTSKGLVVALIRKAFFCLPIRFEYDYRKREVRELKDQSASFDKHVENYRDFLCCTHPNRFKTTFGQRLVAALANKSSKWEEIYACHKPFDRMEEAQPGVCWLCNHSSPLTHISSTDGVKVGKACYEKILQIVRVANMIYTHSQSKAMIADQKESITKDQFVKMYVDICSLIGSSLVPPKMGPDVPIELATAVNAGSYDEKEARSDIGATVEGVAASSSSAAAAASPDHVDDQTEYFSDMETVRKEVAESAGEGKAPSKTTTVISDDDVAMSSPAPAAAPSPPPPPPPPSTTKKKVVATAPPKPVAATVIPRPKRGRPPKKTTQTPID